jgi:hypothetical protein
MFFSLFSRLQRNIRELSDPGRIKLQYKSLFQPYLLSVFLIKKNIPF